MKCRFALFFIVSIFIFQSCNDCHLVDCGSIVGFNIQIVDKVTLNNLLAEPDSLYRIDNMSLSSLVDGEHVDGILFRSNLGINDSLPIQCWSSAPPDMMFLKLNEEETDTLAFISAYFEDECCEWYRLDSVSINGADNISVVNSTVTLLK